MGEGLAQALRYRTYGNQYTAKAEVPNISLKGTTKIPDLIQDSLQGGNVAAEDYVGTDVTTPLAAWDKIRMTVGDTPKAETGWFGSGGYLSTGADVLKAGSSLLNAYTGMQQLGLAKDQFAAEQAAARTNLANQADLINEGRANSTNVGLALAGGTMTDDQKNAARAATTAGNVSRTFN